MHSIKLFLVQTGQSWTLKPSREYVIGNGQDCDISLPDSDTESTYQLKFGVDTVENSWYSESLGNTNALIGNEALTRNLIREQTQITITTNIFLIATPEGSTQVSSSSSSQATSSYPSQTSGYSTNARANYSAYSQSESLVQSLGDGSRAINLGLKWFKISSPDDGVGVELTSFRLVQTHRAEREKVERVCKKLYERVLQKVNEGSVGDAKILSFIYRKGFDDRRRFIRISRDTAHGVRTTIFVRFLSYGDNLYVGLNVYVLGEFNWIKFLLKVLLTIVLFLFSWTLLPLVLIVLMWWKLAWRISYEGKVGLAFRQEFPGGLGNDLFNIDDIFMFARSTTNLIVPAIKDIFEEEGLPLEALKGYIQQVVNNYSTEITNESGGVIGAIAGTASSVMGNEINVHKT